MNWRLILTLSLFGVAMAFASLFGVIGRLEPLLWLVIFIFYAWWIAKHCTAKYFLHGFLVSASNGVWISVIHAAFFSTYLKNNPDMLASYQRLPQGIRPRLMMLIVGPIIGLLTGLVAGLFAFLAAKLVRNNPSVA